MEKRIDPEATAYGWLMVVVSSAIMAFGLGTLFSISVFLKPLGMEFGWQRGDTAFAYTLATFFRGLVGILMGSLSDRYSTRLIVLCGAVAMGAGLLLLSRVETLWQFYVLYGLMIGGLALSSFLTPLTTNIGFWFSRNRGLALGLVLAGQTAGGAIIPPFARYLLANFGWRHAYQVLGIVAWAAMVPLAFLVREPPNRKASQAAAREESLRTHGTGEPFLKPGTIIGTLSLAVVLCCICMAIPLIHVVALATDQGISGEAAAGILSVLMVAGLIGRVGIGKVADHLGGLRALLLASAGQTLMIFWFTQVQTVPGLSVIAVLFGLAYGGVLPCYAFIVRELIPAHRAGAATGMVFFFGNIGMGLGGFLGGFLFDLTGTYVVPYAIGAVFGSLNMVVIGLLYYHIRHNLPASAALPSVLENA